ncbi:hypothetical protein [Pyrodictium delaneyi]|nr:hypothetical protein [Pyrodictium delaneyi]
MALILLLLIVVLALLGAVPPPFRLALLSASIAISLFLITAFPSFIHYPEVTLESTTCQLDAVHISAKLEPVTNQLVLVAHIQPPNPCYVVKVESLQVTNIEETSNQVIIAAELRLRIEKPPPGTVCIQVLPTPIKSELLLTRVESSKHYVVILNAKSDSRECRLELSYNS